MVYTAAAGVPPQQVLPIQLDVGCNTPEVRDHPLYMGLLQVGPPTSASKPTTTNFNTVLASMLVKRHASFCKLVPVYHAI